VACAHFGAHVVGGDINGQLLHGRGHFYYYSVK